MSQFKAGDRFTLSEVPEYTSGFKDCTVGKVYEIYEVCHGGTWFIFVDDIDEVVRVGYSLFKYIILEPQIELATPPVPVRARETPNFYGYKTVQDFETIINYALDHNDLELFNECTAELDKRNMLEEYAL